MTELVYRPSSHSGNGANCTEVAAHSAGVSVRDSKQPDGPTIECTYAGWAVFVRECAHGLPNDNGEIVVTTEQQVRTYAVVGAKVTCWHLHAVNSDVVLHFTEGERDAFVLGARDGEFSFSDASRVLTAAS
ncbi:MAG TPA: DUF397 domain-containing protein [Pseudonocardiaceae bacterium]|nr:DUF397 domain-containing protein [Pseudonocardiaceae bacterium]